MLTQLTLQQLLFAIILIAAFVLLFTEWVRNDVVAILIILSLTIFQLLKPEDALSGFGSEPAIIAACMFIVSEALFQTGVSESIGNWIGRIAGGSYTRTVSTIMLAVAGMSAFTHHVTTTAMMLPPTLKLARDRDIPASKLLMPLSFSASLGTTITIIGAPAFLLASSLLQQDGHNSLGIFTIAPLGIVLTVVGTIFMATAGRFLLPVRAASVTLGDRSHIDNYFTELQIEPNSSLIGKSLEQIKESGRYRFTVVGWMRNKNHLPLPFSQHKIEPNDILLVNTTPDDLVSFQHEPGFDLHPAKRFKRNAASNSVSTEAEEVVQAVVASNAEFIQRTLRQIDFRRRYGAIVIGFWRQGEFLQQELAEIRLMAGDVLVLQGDKESLARVEKDPAFLMLVPFHSEPRMRQKARLLILIVIGTVVVSAFNLLPLTIAMLSGATLTVMSGCLSLRQAYRAIDNRIYVFIAGAIPLGLAMQQTGFAALLADGLHGLLSNWTEFFVLLMLYAIVGLVTQLMSDAATVALFGPLALALAHNLGGSPQAYIITVAMSAVTACLTPTGHHGNLLVYGPGRYQFGDFLRVGGPLTLVLALCVAFFAPIFWPA
ncbi:MAG: SLC13 family permease [Caldilineaceae bacterium]